MTRMCEIVKTKVRIHCKGITPLIMNSTSEKVVGVIHGERELIGEISPEEIARKCLWLDSDGRPGIPALNLFACLKQGGRYVNFDSKRNITSADGATLLPSFLSIEEFFLPLTGPCTWVVNVWRGRQGTSKKRAAVIIARPRFDQWGFKATLCLTLAPPITEATVKKLITVAGRRAGLGSFRPSRGGPFGQFILEKWEVLKEESV